MLHDAQQYRCAMTRMKAPSPNAKNTDTVRAVLAMAVDAKFIIAQAVSTNWGIRFTDLAYSVNREKFAGCSTASISNAADTHDYTARRSALPPCEVPSWLRRLR
jgi:hypothetical protein